MPNISKFQIQGLFGSRNVALDIDDNTLILVGPNGIGKSTVAGIFYNFITRQWDRLIAYQFETIIITVDGIEVIAHRDDISGLSVFRQIYNSSETPSRIRRSLSKLAEAGELENFIASSMNPSDRAKFAEIIDDSLVGARALRETMSRLLVSTDGESVVSPRLNLEKRLEQLIPGRTLYLPTYRQIEKDIKDIFPNFEKMVRSRIPDGLSLRAGRVGNHYVELVSFGMEDVKENIDKRMEILRDYSLVQYNNLSGRYLRDVIRGDADKYDARRIARIRDDEINSMLSRVNPDVLPDTDKSTVSDVTPVNSSIWS